MNISSPQYSQNKRVSDIFSFPNFKNDIVVCLLVKISKTYLYGSYCSEIVTLKTDGFDSY